MKRLIVSLLLFVSINSYATIDPDNLPPMNPFLKSLGAHQCWMNWETPTTRMDKSPLPIDKIATFEIKTEGVAWKAPVKNTDTHIIWIVAPFVPCPSCEGYEIRTIDTDGRKSDWISACSWN